MTVDEFVERKVLPEFRPVVAAIWSLMKQYAPRAEEAISYGPSAFARGATSRTGTACCAG